MELKDIIKDAEDKMKKTVESTKREFSTLRTGRATMSLVEGIMVDYYGTNTPLKQLATISVPEARLIVIQPWDRNNLENIEKAILKSDLGIMPTNDGKLIRITIPQLTKERREELLRVLNNIAEEGKISIRTNRRHSNDIIEKLEKEKKITEDDKFKNKEKIQEFTDMYIKKIDEFLDGKKKEILS